jgi:putative membrane protein
MQLFKEIRMMVLKRISSIFKILPPLFISACAQAPNRSMGSGGHMMGYGYGGGLIWLIVLILVGVGIYFLLRVFKSKGSGGSIIETPSDILKKRYAKGEIDKEEFERKINDLKS